MRRRKLDGVLLLDKPVGPSSSAVLQAVKRLLNAEKLEQRADHPAAAARGLERHCEPVAVTER